MILAPPPAGEPPCSPVRDCIDFDVTLVGNAVDFLPHLVGAIIASGEAGLGPERIVACLERVTARAPGGRSEPVFTLPRGFRGDVCPTLGLDDLPPLDLAGGLNLTFQTPLRLSAKRRPPRDISFAELARAIMRRGSALGRYCCGVTVAADYPALTMAARGVATVAADLRPIHLSRWSSRQQQRLPLDGLIGTISFAGEALAAFEPWIRLGQHVHVGKGTVMGLGRYAAMPLSSRGSDQ
ncbi:MAG: CRISPR system precrRNA processing endoribonuclease RAMP protein Cas6 [Candidatus Schekmanbacteria bacterium]|nr:CRISPR system precrRNA processing endoribonuclease RAMP protein Cas6 [Candidatus Schekmanbacteria bacterium]